MRCLVLALTLLVVATARGADASEIAALAYHDVVLAKTGDPFAITVAEFRRQLDYLVREGYQPISLQTLERARTGAEELPEKPVLLTFDDGFKSYHDIVYPILRKRGFPSVISLVTSWTDRRSAPEYGTAQFMSWSELRELVRSPLVEVLTHSDDLHHLVPANPFGANMPAVETRIYDAKAGKYETEAAHRERVRADLTRSIERIRKELGVAPLGITWPYGSYDEVALEVSAQLGLRYYLTLDEQPTTRARLLRINRMTFRDYRGLGDLSDALTLKNYRKRQWRFVSVDLAALAGLDPAEQARRIADLGRRVELLRANAVVLNPFTADGGRAYFHTDAVPVAADVLSQVAFQLNSRVGIRFLVVRVPVGIDARAYADLARLNWFSGAAIEGATNSVEFERVAELLRRYKPTLKLGVDQATPNVEALADFMLINTAADVPSATLEREVETALKTAAKPFFLLQRSPTTTDATLRAAMATLRSAGALHYGYGPDDFMQNRPEFLRIVRPLGEYTIPPASP